MAISSDPPLRRFRASRGQLHLAPAFYFRPPASRSAFLTFFFYGPSPCIPSVWETPPINVGHSFPDRTRQPSASDPRRCLHHAPPMHPPLILTHTCLCTYFGKGARCSACLLPTIGARDQVVPVAHTKCSGPDLKILPFVHVVQFRRRVFAPRYPTTSFRVYRAPPSKISWMKTSVTMKMYLPNNIMSDLTNECIA